MFDWNLANVKNTYEKYAAAGTTYWSSTTVYQVTVPGSRRYWLIGGQVNRSQNATLEVVLYDASDNVVWRFLSSGAATGITSIPSTAAGTTYPIFSYPIPMDKGWYIKATFGAAQDTSAYAAFIFMEVPV